MELEALKRFKEVFANLEGEERVQDFVTEALNLGVSPTAIIKAMSEALDQIGSKYQKGDLFLSDLIMAGLMANTVSALLDPHFKTDYKGTLGIIVIGTVKGDLHDIGKNIVSILLRGAGYTVIDLGNDIDPQTIVNAVKQEQPQFLGLSALLTSTMAHMEETITALEENGLRDSVKVIIGGAPVSEEFAQRIGADGYGADGFQAVAVVESLSNT